MATVALSMIVKDEFQPVSKLISDAIPYFDDLCIVVSDKPTANKLKAEFKQYPHIYIKWREWNDHFDDARNASMALCKTDYFFWLDADDTFDFSLIPQMVELAEAEGLDAIFLPYNYAQDDRGHSVTRHWRERLIRNNGKYSWRGWVHETCISDDKPKTHMLDNEVTHHIDYESMQGSLERNYRILLKAYEATEDPRYLVYLGHSLFSKKKYEECIKVLLQYLEVGGSVEDAYHAMSTISEAAYFLGSHDVALEYAFKMTALKPEYPMGYWCLAQYEADQERWHEALEWVRVSETKPDPKSLSVFDPTARERARLVAAQAEFSMGNFNAALAWLRKIPNNSSAQDLMEDFQKEADTETFIALLPQIEQFFTDPATAYQALSKDLKYDPRLQDLRFSVTTPVEWGEKSIVILCGQGYEEWGPHTLDKGMGGSEEAVVYLSRELQKLGWQVTVYGDLENTLHDLTNDHTGGNAVIYHPWQEFDKRDKFNVFVAWRAPQFTEHVEAKVKLADIHDVLPESMIKDYPDVTYMFKSQYHADLYKNLSVAKAKVCGNGINKADFHD